MRDIALVHDWLVAKTGSEQVFAAMLDIWPEAMSMALVDFIPDGEREFLLGHRPQTTFIQNLPFSRRYFRNYLPLFPLAIESLDVSSAQLVLSSSHAVAKGVLTNSEQLHISYVHSPMRYAWDLTHQYLRQTNRDKGLRGTLIRYFLHRIRIWDTVTANRVDHFIANSQYVARRIYRIYRRTSTVIYPPVNTHAFPLSKNRDDYYLTASRLVPYKRVDLIVRAFAESGQRLKVVGEGPDQGKIRKLSAPNIEFLGHQSDAKLAQLMGTAKAFVFVADEDFGMLPVEAQATGTPVIALGRGGSLETVKGVFPGQKPSEAHSGIWMREQTVPALLEALRWFEQHHQCFEAESIHNHAQIFAPVVFKNKIKTLVEEKWFDFENQ